LVDFPIFDVVSGFATLGFVSFVGPGNVGRSSYRRVTIGRLLQFGTGRHRNRVDTRRRSVCALYVVIVSRVKDLLSLWAHYESWTSTGATMSDPMSAGDVRNLDDETLVALYDRLTAEGAADAPLARMVAEEILRRNLDL
jgi:hypothetical protein